MNVGPVAGTGVDRGAPPPSDPAVDIEVFWDPVCPFAWITSRWIVEVRARTGHRIEWRFISLRLVNRHKDYATEFPPEYERGHTAGLRMLRMAASVRDVDGRDALDPLVSAIGESYWDQPAGTGAARRLGTDEHARGVLATAGLDLRHAAALEDDSWDALLLAEGEMALERTGRDVGTPIITFGPPDGLSFFGPVISRVPTGEDAVRLWEAVITLAGFDGFAEMKRSLREVPQLEVLGGRTERRASEDWAGGHRRGHLPGDGDGDGDGTTA